MTIKLCSVLALTAVAAPLAPARAQEDEFDWYAWYRDHGFDGFSFSEECVSVGSDGSVVRDEPLPVSRDRWLECSTYDSPTYQSVQFKTSSDEVYCALGEIANPRGEGDDRLTVEIRSQTAKRAWTLRATSRTGEAFGVVAAGGAFGGRIWPVWVQGHYHVLKIVAVGPTDDCDQVFGL